MDDSWRPTPKFLLRRKAVTRLTRLWEPGRFLEVGAGTGTMTRSFLDRDFTGVCQDISQETRYTLSSNLAEYGDRIEILDSIEKLPDSSFDYLFAFEVLEHIEDDLNALRAWSEKLKESGALLVSVPAHQKKFSKEDEFVGHVRRYEKPQLEKLLVDAGYDAPTIFSYGFPIGNLSGWLSRTMNLSGGSRNQLSMHDRSIRSGIERSPVARKSRFLVNRFTIWPFSVLQLAFLTTNLGDGYIAIGRKR